MSPSRRARRESHSVCECVAARRARRACTPSQCTRLAGARPRPRRAGNLGPQLDRYGPDTWVTDQTEDMGDKPERWVTMFSGEIGDSHWDGRPRRGADALEGDLSHG